MLTKNLSSSVELLKSEIPKLEILVKSDILKKSKPTVASTVANRASS